MSEAADLQRSSWEQPLRCLIAFGLMALLPALLWVAIVHVGMVDPSTGDQQTARQAIFVGCGAAVVLFAHFLPPAVAWLPLRSGAVLRCYVPFAILWVAVLIGYLRIMHSVGHPVAPQQQLQYLAANGLSTPAAWLMVFLVVAVAPVVEEVVFRGYLLGVLLQVVPSRFAQAITAVMFGLVHGYDYVVPIALLGWFFGWLRQRHGALCPSMFAHALHNALVLAVTCAWPESLELLYPG